MTRINRMVCNGFKSFAKHTELVFGGDFNCILGPNGSGKSNVLDALCFVLGKSSAKSLRAEKAANLIYNGGKNKNPLNKAEVSIYFSNDNKTFPTEDDEIKISRIVKSNGQSTYRINDEKVTRQQILDLLRFGKINPDGYNIILQGDIVNFVNMPPSSRRELVDEISGITLYEEKKHKAELELGKVELKLKEADIILTERGTYLRELKNERNQALKFKDAQDHVNENKGSYLKIRINKKEKIKASHDKRNADHKAQLEKINKGIEEIRNKNSERKKEIEDITKEVEEKGEKEQIDINKDIENLKVELAKKTTRVENLKNEITKIKKRKEELGNDNGDIKKKVEDMNQTIKELKESYTEIKKTQDELVKKIEAFKKKHNLDASSTIEEEIEKIDHDVEEKQKLINEMREKQQAMFREKDRIEYQINTADEKIDKVKEIESEHKSQLNDLKRKRATFAQLGKALNDSLEQDAVYASTISESRKQLIDAEQHLAKLTARNIHIREKTSMKMGVKKIMEQKSKMDGIYGTIAELGSVDSKYSAALETAAGGRMDSIVVEDDQVAAHLISYLKKNKFGIATFLPLNKITAKPVLASAKSLAEQKGSLGLALDLIEFDPKFKAAFSYVFQNTVVVETIQTARALGIGKAKMVTLDGDVAELSGVMKGGFRKKKEVHGFEAKDVTQGIAKQESLIQKLNKEIIDLEKKRESNEQFIMKSREEKAHLEGEIIKTEKSLHLDDSDLEVNKKQKEEYKKLLTETEKSLNSIKDEVMDVTRSLGSLKAKKQELRTKINELRNPRLLAELNTFEQKKQDYNEELININSEIKNYTGQLESIHKPELDKIQAIIKQHQQEEKQFSELVSNLDKEIRDGKAELKQKEIDAQKFFKRFKQLFATRSKINEEIQKNDAVINKKLDGSREIELKMNTVSLDLARISAELAGLEQEFEQYRDVKLNLNKTEEEYKSAIAKYERILGNMGNINMKALEIYDTVEKEYNSLQEKKVLLAKEKEDIEALMLEIEGKKKDLFMDTFKVVNDHFQAIFSKLTTKGEAALELENPENPFEGGLNVRVKLSANKYMDIKSLSGGEKTLTALAFIFAIQECDPASFYVLDEVDAALDKRNSEKLAKLIRNYTGKAQYVVISHNDSMISEADSLFGVSMNEHGMSSVVSLKV